MARAESQSAVPRARLMLRSRIACTVQEYPMTLSACALLIGFVAGLRAMTAPAAVGWAAYLGWLPPGWNPAAGLPGACQPHPTS